MIYESLKGNLKYMGEITKEIYIFANHLDVIKNLEINAKSRIDNKEKRLLNETIVALTNQLKILNSSIPRLIEGIGFYKKLKEEEILKSYKPDERFIQVSYKPLEGEGKVSLVMGEKDKKDFLENLSKSNLSINQLKKGYSVEKPLTAFGKASEYAKISNRLFKRISNNLISKGYFENLNKSLRKMNSNFVVGTYVSMIFFSVLISFLFSILLLGLLLFFKITPLFPFLTPVEETILVRFLKIFWIVFTIPFVTGLLIYIYPSSESKNLGKKIDQELPFVTIHMSAIAGSGIEPLSIFKILIRNEEYKYTNIEIRKLMNLINFHGEDLVNALKKVSRSSPSSKLRELLDGLATTITSGGSLSQFLDKHADTLLFDYRLERERHTKAAETFMDIYISVVIAAPMILLLLFVIIGSTGALANFLGLSTNTLSLLVILMIVLLNIGFLVFLRLQQPEI